MAYFRKLETQLITLLELLSREERWLILINADPDALGSALALRRIMIHRVQDVAIANVNEVSRPDNLAMISYLRIPTRKLTPNLAAQYDRFALVDSQPHHHPAFKDFSFSLILDHHPIIENKPALADFKDIKPNYGANCTLMTEYLYNLKIRPGQMLATALMYGIKNDTLSFERNFCDVDMRAFRYLSKHANQSLLRKIVRSEFRMPWLHDFAKAFDRIRFIHKGFFIYMDEVDNPDILVILADFFMRVQEISWCVVSGTYDDQAVLIFRGDGFSRGVGDVGKIAMELFGDVGSAGGHKAMARAEIPLENIVDQAPEEFIAKRLRRKSPKKKRSS